MSSSSSGNRSEYDTDVTHYSISELLDLVGLGGLEGISENEFSDIIQGFVDKYREVDIVLSRFFSDVGRRLYSLLVAEGGGGGAVEQDAGELKQQDHHDGRDVDSAQVRDDAAERLQQGRGDPIQEGADRIDVTVTVVDHVERDQPAQDHHRQDDPEIDVDDRVDQPEERIRHRCEGPFLRVSMQM